MRRVTLELPDEVLNRAERLAVLTHRDVADVLAEAVSAVLPPVDVTAEEAEISKLSDAAVLRLADASFFASEEDRLSLLLDKQQSGTLTHGERLDLLSLMRIYEASWLRQAEALAEAVRRGLREPLPS
jgi:predicted transcriptional regulator